jgi:hypothetical protein
MTPVDDVLAETYAAFAHSVDRITSTLSLREEFLARRPPECSPLETDVLIHRLLNLRKRGKLPKRPNQGS